SVLMRLMLALGDWALSDWALGGAPSGPGTFSGRRREPVLGGLGAAHSRKTFPTRTALGDPARTGFGTARMGAFGATSSTSAGRGSWRGVRGVWPTGCRRPSPLGGVRGVPPHAAPRAVAHRVAKPQLLQETPRNRLVVALGL